MSSALTTFRADLQTVLAAAGAFSTYSFNAGAPPASGAVPDSSPLGYVWVEKTDTDQGNQLLQNITCGVRLYVVWSQRIDPQTPADPTPLEQAAADLQTTLAPASFPGDPWFFTIESIEFQNDDGYVEATIVGTRWNDGTVS